ncbi:hypothetical protein GQ55_3G287900 [Panicum hallii var. hallii]|uniref:Uncharacterized protein n=1 Tax=Panicum hallii var. hallii TaxID=1504633 RepID=A0A2T7EED7_9POAL|nr:hypothetical protein GQ55_3G287900 [Panicum hallii var. hallii]
MHVGYLPNLGPRIYKIDAFYLIKKTHFIASPSRSSVFYTFPFAHLMFDVESGCSKWSTLQMLLLLILFLYLGIKDEYARGQIRRGVGVSINKYCFL